jgi:large subunit ribosomal protein L9
LGKSGDIKQVSDGHARNFLIPKHFALPATSSVLATVQKEEKERQEKFAKLQEWLATQKDKLEGKAIILKGRAEKQNLFAAIHEKEIAQAVNEKFHLELQPNQVILDKAIKSLGIHEVTLKLAENLKVKINQEVQGN